VVSQTCNPSYSGFEDPKDHSSRPAQGEKVRPHLDQLKLGMVVHACHPTYMLDGR
jgi:hypothetical protein